MAEPSEPNVPASGSGPVPHITSKSFSRSGDISLPQARELAYQLVGQLRPRWDHVWAAGHRAEDLCGTTGLGEHIAVAAWLHDIGYGSAVVRTGFHPLDGAQFLDEKQAPSEITRLVAWHTGAGCEAHQRGLFAQLAAFPQPDPDSLDALTMIDLATGPSGQAVLDTERISEILSRYAKDHPVHRAVSLSKQSVLTASHRAKARLGLPQDWPVGS